MNKKVGFLIMNFESGGGTERVTSVIANELVKKNFDVRIISCQHGNISIRPQQIEYCTAQAAFLTSNTGRTGTPLFSCPLLRSRG